jgi:hypothetical protein
MELFDQFIQEQVYLKGVSPKTVVSYQRAFKACPPTFGKCLSVMPESNQDQDD